MDYRLETSAEFERDMGEALNHISNKLLNLSAASSLSKKVRRKISFIQTNPFMYPRYHDKRIKSANFRYAVVDNYLLFYHVDEATNVISIEAFVYGKQDLTAIIK